MFYFYNYFVFSLIKLYKLYCFSTSYTWPTNPILEGKIEEGVEKEVERYVYFILFLFYIYYLWRFGFFNS